MSEFSSGPFKPFQGPHQFFLNHKFNGVPGSEAEDESYEDVNWRVDDSSIHMEEVIVVVSDQGASFLTHPDSALMPASSTTTFDHFSEHAVVEDEIIPRDSSTYEQSSDDLQYSSSSPAKFHELYGGGYNDAGEERWQSTGIPNTNDSTCNSSDVPVVVPFSPQETRRGKSLTRNHSASSNSPTFSSPLASSFSFQKFSAPPVLQLSSPSSGMVNNVSSPGGTPLGLDYKATVAAYRNSPKPPVSEPKTSQGLPKLERGDTKAEAASTMTLGFRSQSLPLNYQRALKVARTAASDVTDVTLGKRQRYDSRLTSTDHIEHVQRERQRRDDMSAKISTLETLLPPAPKRDRVSIVHDGIQYVKALQQNVKALQERLHEAKRKGGAGVQDKKRRSSAGGSSTCSKLGLRSSSRDFSTASLDITRPTVAEFGTFPASPHGGRGDPEGSGLSNSVPSTWITPKREPNTETRDPISVELHVQVDRPGEKVQVVRCNCRYTYLSSVMRTLEQLQLNLHRCSITKLHDCVICVIVIKPTSNCSIEHNVSSAQIATLLWIAAVASP